VVLPAESLNAEDVFIDSVPLAELRARLHPAEVRTGHEVTEALRDA
jgi:hypothetical protein